MDPNTKKTENEEINSKTENLDGIESTKKDSFSDLWDNFSGTHFY